MGLESPLYASGTYKPPSSVLSEKYGTNPKYYQNNPLPDLAKIPTNQITPLNQAQQDLIKYQQQQIANTLANGASPAQLQQIAAKGGVYTQAAVQEMSRQGMTPRITATASAPSLASASNPFPASATAQATATRAPIASSPLANGLVGTVGAFGGEKLGSQLGGELGGAIGQATGAGLAVAAITGNPVAGLATAGVSLAGSAALKGADALGNALAGSLAPSPLAKASLEKAEAKYQQALANRSKARPASDLGSNYGASQIQSENPTFPTPALIASLIGGVAGYELLRNDNQWVGIGLQFWTKEQIELAVFFPDDDTARANGHTEQNGTIQTYFKAIRQAGSPDPLINPNSGFPKGNTPFLPTTSPQKDPNNSNNFPYLPTVNTSDRAALAYAPAQTAQPLPFKEKEEDRPLQFAPTPTAQPSAAPSPLANSSPSYKTPETGSPNTTSASSNGSAFTPSPTVSPSQSTSLTNSPDPNINIKPSANQPDLARPTTPQTTANPTTPTQPNTPAQPNNQTGQILAAIAALTGTVVGGNALLNYIRGLNEQINNQTKPEAQQTNAKQGVCDAMQPQQCGYEGVKQATTEATDPIKQTATANNGLLQALQTALSALTAFLTSNIGKILDLLNRQVVDRVLAITTFAMTLHNALMLSQGIGDTVGGIVDNILNLTGLSFKNSEGATVGAGEVIGANFRNFMISVIGEANYTTLSTTFAQANRIYQAGMNIVNNVQSILDSAASVAQSTGINVAKIGNALRDNHVVSPREYSHMDDSPEGNRATKLSRFQQLTTIISDADSNLQNLASITGSVVSIKDSVKQSKDDIKNFNDARAANSQANQEAKEAIQQQIKELKPLTEITIAKREEDN